MVQRPAFRNGDITRNLRRIYLCRGGQTTLPDPERYVTINFLSAGQFLRDPVIAA